MTKVYSTSLGSECGFNKDCTSCVLQISSIVSMIKNTNTINRPRKITSSSGL